MKLQSNAPRLFDSSTPGDELQKHILRRQAVPTQRRGQRPNRAPVQLPCARAQARTQRVTCDGRVSLADHCDGMQARHLQATRLSLSGPNN